MRDAKAWASEVGDDESLDWLIDAIANAHDQVLVYDMNAWLVTVDRPAGRIHLKHQFVDDLAAELDLDAFIQGARAVLASDDAD